MRLRRTIRLGCGLCLCLIFFLLIVAAVTLFNAPKSLANSKQGQSTALNARVYLTQDTLKQPLQTSINQQIPKIAASALGQLSNIPGVASLIQPSAQLSTLTPEANGLKAGLNISMYPGAQPINTNVLLNFSLLNSSTIQANAHTVPGSPITYNGQLTTIAIPVGKLTSIQTTPSCGKAALTINLQLPVNLGQAQLQNTRALADTDTTITSTNAPVSFNEIQTSTAQSATSTYVEIPASSLSALAANMGTLPLGNGLEASNTRLNFQNRKLVVSTDIYSNVVQGRFIKVGTAVTTIEPGANNGNLQMHVVNTDLHVLLFTFPINNFNQQIEQKLNSKIGAALNGHINVNAASIGPDANLPCAAATSLLLSGTTSIG